MVANINDSVKPRQRDCSVDLYKGIAIIGVIFFHLSNRRLSVETNSYISIFVSFFSWSILGFVFVAAILHSRQIRGRNVVNAVISRFMRLIVPYFTIGFIYLVIWYFSSQEGGGGGRDLLLRLLTVQNPIGEQLYFLPLLFLSFLAWVWVTSSDVLSVHFVIFLGIVLCVLIGHIFLFPNIGFGRGITIFNLTAAVLTYGLGIGYASLVDNYSKCKVSLAVLFLLLVGAVVLIVTESSGVCIPALAIGIFHVVRIFGVTFPLLERVGKASGWIYAYHTPFIIYPLLIVSVKIGAPEWLCVLSAGVGSLLLAWGLGLFLNKFSWGKYVLA